jgi:hypothetical protein
VCRGVHWRRFVVGAYCRGRHRPGVRFAVLQRPVPVVVLVRHRL